MSFVYAINGIGHAFYKNRSITIQLIIGAAVIALSLFLKIPWQDLIIILFLCFLVIILEMINTAVEKMIDVLSPKYHKEYGKVKDIMAGAVLLAAVLSVIIGILILWQPLLAELHK
jgi:undecaprenol kinase